MTKKEKFLQNLAQPNMVQETVDHPAQNGAHPKGQQQLDLSPELNSSAIIYQSLLIPDEECLAEAERASFDIVGSREGFHLFGRDIYITGVQAKIYITNYRVSPLNVPQKFTCSR